MIEEELRCVIAGLQKQCEEKDKEIAVFKRMAKLLVRELSCVEIAPPICDGCKEIEGFYNGSCGSKECLYWMFEREAKGLSNYGLQE